MLQSWKLDGIRNEGIGEATNVEEVSEKVG